MGKGGFCRYRRRGAILGEALEPRYDMTQPIYRGSCLCGGVKYEVSSEIKAVSHCHCSMCRKAHGAAFATYGSVPSEKHVFTEGEALLRRYQSSDFVTRTFCSLCGSPLLWRSQKKFIEWVSFPLGTLDTPYVPLNQKHLHVTSKAPWHHVEEPPLGLDDSSVPGPN